MGLEALNQANQALIETADKRIAEDQPLCENYKKDKGCKYLLVTSDATGVKQRYATESRGFTYWGKWLVSYFTRGVDVYTGDEAFEKLKEDMKDAMVTAAKGLAESNKGVKIQEGFETYYKGLNSSSAALEKSLKALNAINARIQGVTAPLLSSLAPDLSALEDIRSAQFTKLAKFQTLEGELAAVKEGSGPLLERWRRCETLLGTSNDNLNDPSLKEIADEGYLKSREEIVCREMHQLVKDFDRDLEAAGKDPKLMVEVERYSDYTKLYKAILPWVDAEEVSDSPFYELGQLLKGPEAKLAAMQKEMANDARRKLQVKEADLAERLVVVERDLKGRGDGFNRIRLQNRQLQAEFAAKIDRVAVGQPAGMFYDADGSIKRIRDLQKDNQDMIAKLKQERDVSLKARHETVTEGLTKKINVRVKADAFFDELMKEAQDLKAASDKLQKSADEMNGDIVALQPAQKRLSAELAAVRAKKVELDIIEARGSVTEFLNFIKGP